MTRALLAVVTITLAVSGCSTIGSSRLNPVNWFSESQSQPPTLEMQQARDSRPDVERVVSMELQRTPDGALLHAVGLPPSQGWWDAELVPENGGRVVDGTLSFRFKVAPPPRPTRVSTQMSRELTAAVRLSKSDLRGVRRIVVRGATNQQVARR